MQVVVGDFLPTRTSPPTWVCVRQCRELWLSNPRSWQTRQSQAEPSLRIEQAELEKEVEIRNKIVELEKIVGK